MLQRESRKQQAPARLVQVARFMLASREGVSARQLWRYMGFGSLKTAWYMARRLHSALIEKNMDKLGGIVEVDEGFVGG